MAESYSGIDTLLSGLGLLGSIYTAGEGSDLVNQAYTDLGAAGEQAFQGAYGFAQEALDQTKFKPFSLTTATGATFNPNAEGGYTMGLSETEQRLMNQLGTQAGSYFTAAGADQGARQQEIYDAYRAMQQPEEERQRLSLENRLAGQGRLGVRTSAFGGTPEQLAMAKAQEEAKNTAAFQAMQQTQQERLQNQQMGMSSLQGMYTPQAMLLNATQPAQNLASLAQQGQLTGASLYGEAGMSGLEALLGARLGQANLIGGLGAGMLGGASDGLFGSVED